MKASTPADAYARKKEIEAARNAAASAKGREIGELPPIADPARRERCRFDLKTWLDTYLAKHFYLGWSPDLLEACKRLEQVILHGGQQPCAMPRSGGKSTLGRGATMWAALEGHRKFIQLIGANKTLARGQLLNTIKRQLLTNPLLLEDYPEVCVPVRKVGNIANRCNGQTYRGEPTFMEWGKDKIVFAAIPDTRGGGAIINCSGLDGGIRGQNEDGPRPDFAFVDDPQTKRSARSPLQTQYRLEILQADVRGLAGPDKEIAMYAAMTVIYPGDLADQLLDPELHPEWHGKRYQLLYEFPTDMDLWRRYADLRERSQVHGGEGEEATAFYKKNRAAMDKGARVAWEDRKLPRHLSALQYAMDLFFDNPETFWAEYQNLPRRADGADDAVELKPKDLRFRVTGQPQGLVRAAATHLVGHVDVQHSLLWWGSLACDDYLTGDFDYGCWPKQKRKYFTLRDPDVTLADLYPDHEPKARVRQGLIDLLRELLGNPRPREGGGVQPFELILVDWSDGAMAETVAEVCRMPEFAAVVLPAAGRYIGPTDAPMEKWPLKQGERLGHHWVYGVNRNFLVRNVVVDSNYWKSHAAGALSAPVGNAGAVAFWGNRETDHRMLAEQLTAERMERLTAEKKGRTVEVWKNPPSKPDNHHFDNLYNCLAAGSMKGCKVRPPSSTAAATAAPRRTVKRKRPKNNVRPMF